MSKVTFDYACGWNQAIDEIEATVPARKDLAKHGTPETLPKGVSSFAEFGQKCFDEGFAAGVQSVQEEVEAETARLR